MLCDLLMQEAKRRFIMLNLATLEDSVTHHTILSRACAEGDSGLLGYLIHEGLEVLFLTLQLQKRALQLEQQQKQQKEQEGSQQQQPSTLPPPPKIPSPFDFITSDGMTLLASAIVGLEGGSGGEDGEGNNETYATRNNNIGRIAPRSEAAIAATVSELLKGAKAKQLIPSPIAQQQAPPPSSSQPQQPQMIKVGPFGIDIDIRTPRFGGQTALQIAESMGLEEVSRMLATA